MDASGIFMDEIEKIAFEGVSLSRQLKKGDPTRSEVAGKLREGRSRHPAQGRIIYAGLRGEGSDVVSSAAVQAEKELGRPKLLSGASSAELSRLRDLASRAPMSTWLKAGLIGIPATGAVAGGAYLIHRLLKRQGEQPNVH